MVADPVAAELEAALAWRRPGADPKTLRCALRRIEELLLAGSRRQRHRQALAWAVRWLRRPAWARRQRHLAGDISCEPRLVAGRGGGNLDGVHALIAIALVAALVAELATGVPSSTRNKAADGTWLKEAAQLRPWAPEK